MGKRTHARAWTAALGIAIGVSLIAIGGCRAPSPVLQEVAYRYFVEPNADDAWSRKIRGWQQRERADIATPAVATEPPRIDPEKQGVLRTKYDAFRAERKRALARELESWIQTQSRDHYIADGPVDHWATLEETFRTNGDDCDGLELLTFHLLRDLGFGEDEVFRAIVVRPSDGQHHMVTLWFEDADDPWVIDPTGAMTTGLPRMSEVPEWVPLKVFSEDRDFTVRNGRLHTASR